MKPVNQKAWLLVLPVLLIVAFSAVIPLMTVVNYSVQDSFGNNQFFWNGVGWFAELLDPKSDLGSRFYDSLWRNLAFSGDHPRDRDPARHPGRAIDAAPGLDGLGDAGADGAAAADPVERGRHDLADLRARRHRPVRRRDQRPRHPLQLRLRSGRGLVHHHRDGCLALDLAGRPALLCRPEVDPGRLLPGGRSTAPRAGLCSAPSSCRR
jgi:hypothetical protein